MTGSILDLTPAVAELFLAASALVLMAVGSLREQEAGRLVLPLSVLSLLVATAIVIGADHAPTVTFGGHFRQDAFAAFLKVLCYLGVAGSLILAPAYLEDEDLARFEYPLLGLFAALGMSLMVSANSFLGLYVGLELQSLALYVLTAFHRDTLRSSEAGLKYFLLGALASGILLYGMSLIYGFTGTISFDALAARFTPGADGAVPFVPLGALVGLVMVAAGLAFKLAAVPFHMWTPDVYEGAPTPVTAFIATAPKIAAMGLTLRVLVQPFGEIVAQWQQIIVLISIASMLLGVFAAIGQTNIKRLMAYSGIANMGYALVGLAAGTASGASAVLVFLAIYLVMSLGTFGVILAMRRQGRYVEQIQDLAGLSRRQPMLAAALAILMFSLAGIPPLAGFFGKLYVFLAAIDAGLTILAVIGLLSSVVAAYYYLRIVKLIYFDPPAEAFDTPAPGHVGTLAGFAAAAMLLMVVLINPLFASAQAAAVVLFD